MQKNLKRDNRAPMSADAGMKNGGMKAVKNLRMLRFRIVRSCLYAVSLLPLSVLYAVSDFLCLFVSRFYRTRVVRSNLAGAFPEKSEHERRKIERRFYHQFCDNVVENIKALSMSREDMIRRMTFSGLEHIRQRHEAGQSLHFLYSAHMGNWEWIASINYHLCPWGHSAQVYHRIHDKAFERLFQDLRAKAGGINIEMKETFRRILQLRKEGKNYTIIFISDQQPTWNSIHHFVPFLNHDTAVFIGAEHIARKVDAFMCYGRMTRPRRGYYHLEIVPMEDHPSSVPENTLTNRYCNMLEQDVREHPEMWLWTHKCWSRTKEEWLRRKQTKEDKSQSSK